MNNVIAARPWIIAALCGIGLAGPIPAQTSPRQEPGGTASGGQAAPAGKNEAKPTPNSKPPPPGSGTAPDSPRPNAARQEGATSAARPEPGAVPAGSAAAAVSPPAAAKPNEGAAPASPPAADEGSKSPASRGKKRAHAPVPAFDRAVDPTVIPTPPPGPQAEQPPPRPGDNYVWVAGQYVPVERQWTWTPGKWSIPPEAGSVWIPGRYDARTQKWTFGYWQPGDTSGNPTVPPTSPPANPPSPAK